MKVRYLPGHAWLAVPDHRQNLLDELNIDPENPGESVILRDDLVYQDLPAGESPPLAFWHRVRLERPFIAEFDSISEAAAILRGIQRNWAHYPLSSFRRAELIKDKLPYVNEKPREFPYQVPLAPMGVWTLLDAHTLFASAETSSPFPAGEIRFVEDHENPPSRAYLKLYEALCWVDYLGRSRVGDETTIPTGRYTGPSPGTKVIDAGACPGGWTWVLDRLGAEITAIDRAPLAPALMTKPSIRFIKHDAFTLSPAELGPQDWVCSDVICYPPRLLSWVRSWLDSGLCSNFICTIKMQGPADHETTRAFAEIPGSRVIHLTANKNELTWIRLG